ncbi:hypothetical protein LENED_009263 [Lentinula edodes]|uniref:Uncharacterized protein n=1 Tax=Lentinula edodes TaxID=5353 RepID=A0A1Q3EJI9_LENED|nr:hypothetical protein LENED_009263 [Lentinula edodes]
MFCDGLLLGNFSLSGYRLGPRVERWNVERPFQVIPTDAAVNPPVPSTATRLSIHSSTSVLAGMYLLAIYTRKEECLAIQTEPSVRLAFSDGE